MDKISPVEISAGHSEQDLIGKDINGLRAVHSPFSSIPFNGGYSSFILARENLFSNLLDGVTVRWCIDFKSNASTVSGRLITAASNGFLYTHDSLEIMPGGHAILGLQTQSTVDINTPSQLYCYIDSYTTTISDGYYEYGRPKTLYNTSSVNVQLVSSTYTVKKTLTNNVITDNTAAIDDIYLMILNPITSNKVVIISGFCLIVKV